MVPDYSHRVTDTSNPVNTRLINQDYHQPALELNQDSSKNSIPLKEMGRQNLPPNPTADSVKI